MLSGCLNDEPAPVYYDIEGQILENGAPVENAQIHFRNHLDPGGFLEESIGDSVTISFDSVFEGIYTARLYRFRADTAFITFFRDSLGLGAQNISIPDSILSNGIYAYEVISEVQNLGSRLFMVNKSDSALIGTLPVTTSDNSGDFTIDPANLAFGRNFNFSSGFGFEVTDSLEIIVIKNGEVQINENIRVLPDEENYFEITLD
ncbi:MAG: hypothetical protein RI564_05360 [Gracilimonas sp.]|nr:hypothetical protein [Gracilimonas sp.]